MKVNGKFKLHEIAGNYAIVPFGQEAINFNKFVTVNESGKMLWELIEKGTNESELTEALFNEYEVTREVAIQDVKAFVKMLTDNGLVK